VYVIHRHPSLWKPPNEFRPPRFLDGSEDRLHHDKLLPFYCGPRDCIGKYFALLEATLAISALVSLYDLECVDPNEIRFRKREPGSY
jgi:cytochrome P450